MFERSNDSIANICYFRRDWSLLQQNSYVMPYMSMAIHTHSPRYSWLSNDLTIETTLVHTFLISPQNNIKIIGFLPSLNYNLPLVLGHSTTNRLLFAVNVRDFDEIKIQCSLYDIIKGRFKWSFFWFEICSKIITDRQNLQFMKYYYKWTSISRIINRTNLVLPSL